jgi:hypothetical protein
MFKFLSELFLPQNKYKEFAQLLIEVNKIASVYECGLAMKAVIEFRKGIPDDDDEMQPMIGNLVEFIIDTRTHARDGFHKSAKTNWKTSQQHPDINQYFNFENKI